MSKPIEIKKSSHTDFEAARWEGFINFLGQSENNNFSEIQNNAYISNWFNSELLNGGFEQYFYNLDRFNYEDVVNALTNIGAICQSEILKKVMEYYQSIIVPTDYDVFIQWNKEMGYEDKINEFNLHYYQCRPEVETELLTIYLTKHESEFILWE